MESSCASPQELIERGRQGDTSALGELLVQYESYLTLVARITIGQRLQGKLDPGDVVQEVFLEAHRNFGLFRGTTEAQLLAWLRQVLSAQMAMVVRRYFGTKARDVRLERQLFHDVENSSQALACDPALALSTPSQQALKRERAVLVSDALQRLPADYREVIILRNLEGLGFAEVAARMGRSEDSVQKLWVRGLANLRRALGDDFGKPC